MSAATRTLTGAFVVIACLGLASALGASVPRRSEARQWTKNGVTTPTKLVTAPLIQAFAQDGTRIAWFSDLPSPYAPCARLIQVRDLATGTTRQVKTPETCSDSGEFLHGMSLAGKRILWGLGGVDASNQEVYWEKKIYTAAEGEKEHQLDYWSDSIPCEIEEGEHCSIAFSADLIAVGDGNTAFYLPKVGDRVMRATRTRSVVSSTMGALSIDAAGGYLAVLRHAGARWIIQMQSETSGRIHRTFRVPPGAREVAFDGSRFAVLVTAKTGSRIEVRSVTGERLFAVEAPKMATGLSLDGDRLVYSTWKAISIVELRDHTSWVLARARGKIVGLSIEGRRVAWGELGHGIYTVTAP